MKFLLVTSLGLLLGLTACQPSNPDTTVTSADTSETKTAISRRLEAHMSFLADDLLAGRQTGSVEYAIAANYVATQMQQYGLTPGGDDGTWFQDVQFIKSSIQSDSVQITAHGINGDVELTFIDDFIMGANPLTESDQVKADVVFVGYGIVSEQLGHDDYAGLDVENKIVLALRGRPAEFPTEEGAHLASTRTKLMSAVERGALGFINIHTPKMDQVRPYSSYKKYALEPGYHWQNPEGEVYGSFAQIQGSAYLSMPAAGKVFAAGGSDIQPIYEQLAREENPAGFELNLQLTMARESNHSQLSSPNVIGIIEGSDPVLKQEYVTYSAHLDHIGQSHDEEGEDKINNGALDNASGVSVMLETARQFMASTPPKRSMLFVAVTAEERGLLGSSYFANFPTVPQGSMVANINLDMPLILYPFADVIAFGANHTTMATTVETAAAKQGIKLSPDPMPEQALFVRSDHYSFVQQGVPSIFLVPGFESKDPEINGEALFGNFIKTHYHHVSDDLNLPIDYDAGAVFTLVNYEIGNEVANANDRPRWHEGDFFGEIFSEQAKTSEKDTLKERLKTN